mgnify:CR=1|tara:strand:+ start:2100 stop:2945 length:846 start_codon:yes stop_codon:yes gene_type:complete
MGFSERYGFQPKKVFQIEGVDEELSNGLWNIVYEFLQPYYLNDFEDLFKKVWIENLDQRLEAVPMYSTLEYIPQKCLLKLSGVFEKLPWFKKYDLVEFILNIENNGLIMDSRGAPRRNYIKKMTQNILIKHNSAYRLVNWQFIPITNDQEIISIENLSGQKEKFEPVKVHFEKALSFLSDKEAPDYENTIKETVSAIESTLKIIFNLPEGTIGKALPMAEKEGLIGSEFKTIITSLNRFSNTKGIRHGDTEISEIDFATAKYFIVSGSAMINYLIEKNPLN